MSAKTRSRVKIGATLDPGLLEAVDAYVREHPDVDRSAVIDEALQLWCAREQQRQMEEQFARPLPAEGRDERAAWREIQAASAARIFDKR